MKDEYLITGPSSTEQNSSSYDQIKLFEAFVELAVFTYVF